MMLHTTSQSLGDQETASLAEKGYTETARLLMHIDKILPKIVVEELHEDKELHPVDAQDDDPADDQERLEPRGGLAVVQLSITTRSRAGRHDDEGEPRDHRSRLLAFRSFFR